MKNDSMKYFIIICKLMIYLLIYWESVAALDSDCDDRTLVFNSRGNNNQSGYYFVYSTYSAGGADQCTKNSESNNVKFRNAIKDNFQCTYEHCNDRMWACK